MNSDNTDNNRIEDILDQAINQLRQGRPPSEILLSYPDAAAELQPLLEAASYGQNIPQNIVPTPQKRRKYAASFVADSKWSWSAAARLLKFGIMPLALAFVIFGGKTFIDATTGSLPNDPLYKIKRASEQLQLTLTRDSNKQADFQVHLSQKRLQEVQLAAATQDPDTQAAALSELKNQSEETFANVSQVATAKALTNDASLLNSLVAINNQEQEVLNSIQPQPETRDLAANTLTTVQKNGQQLASIVAVVQEQTLADLDNKISISGDATFNPSKREVTIDGTTFAITQDTSILLIDGKTLEPANLPAAAKVNIVGSKTDDTYSAKIISLLNPLVAPIPVVEKYEKPPVKIPVEVKKIDPPAPVEEPTPPAHDPNKVQAGIIVEPPAQQNTFR